MNEIKCPKCGYTIKVSESDYDEILKQVKNEEYNKEIKMHDDMHKLEIDNLKDKIKLEYDLKIASLENTIDNLNKDRQDAINKVSLEEKSKYIDELNKKDSVIKDLENKIELSSVKYENKLKEVVYDKDKDILELNSILDKNKNEYLIKEKSLISSYEDKIKSKDEQIAYYKDFKTRQSTKMVGESLEQHCFYEFNKIRSMFGPNTYFEKDNDAKTGSKGDFIFRDYDEDVEVVSIMFEMKNEMDTTITKHKNEDFFKELDKDRKEKKCEYAVLVSMLEADNDLYNDGIVDVSYKYDKMYVIRPQFFIPLITLIRNISLNSLKYKKELILKEKENIDISNFEENINIFKEGFSRNYHLAADKFNKAIEEIDKTIDHLNKTKDALLASSNQLRLANNKAEDLTIKRLTSNAPTVAEMFREKSK